MATEVLMHFLKKGLFDLNGSDEKLEKLESTVSTLVEYLEKSPSKALSYVLIALDPKAPENDPVIMEVLSALEDNWTTYFNTFSGTPIQVIRALLLQALISVSKKNQQVSIALVSITRNILPYIEVGNEQDMWGELIGNIEQKLNAQAVEEWATPQRISVDSFSYTKVKALKISSENVILDREQLEAQIEKASGPQNKQNQPIEGANRYWPQNNANWSRDFTPRMTAAIADVVDTAFTNAQIKPIDLSQPINKLASDVTNHIDKTLEAISSATAGLQRRTSLIWWKESLYSPSSFCSYRDMPPIVAATVMAFDLYAQVPTLSPASVSAFLFETVYSLLKDEKEEPIQVGKLVKEIQSSEYAEPFCKHLDSLFNKLEGRGPLLRLLCFSFRNQSFDDTQFQVMTGLTVDTSLSHSEWATLIFRELQACRAVLSGVVSDE